VCIIEKILSKGVNKCNVLLLFLKKSPKKFPNSCIDPIFLNLFAGDLPLAKKSRLFRRSAVGGHYKKESIPFFKT
jgi:hypothetical protein